MKMHNREVDIDAKLVAQLVGQQFPHLSDLPVSVVQSTGTVNAIYRIGDELCARLPRVSDWVHGLDREWSWLPRLAAHISLQIPEPVARGHATGSYPFDWAIYRWIAGEPYSDELVEDERQAAEELAGFVAELRQLDPVAEAPRAGRRPLRELDADTRAAIDAAGGDVDRDATIAAWGRALHAPPWDGSPAWIHSDLLRPNVLVKGGGICAVIDFGGVGVGDPAADVIAAWSVFGRDGRLRFRAALDVDDDTWHRAQGLAIHQAAVIIPYYRSSNPRFVTLAQRTISEIFIDSEM